MAHHLKENGCFQEIEEEVPQLKKERLKQWRIISDLFLVQSGTVRKDFQAGHKVLSKKFPPGIQRFYKIPPRRMRERTEHSKESFSKI